MGGLGEGVDEGCQIGQSSGAVVQCTSQLGGSEQAPGALPGSKKA